MKFARPYTLKGGSGFGCPIVIDAAGQIVAMGSLDLMRRVMAGEFKRPTQGGDLFNAD